MWNDEQGCLSRQLDICWQLTEYHLNGLTTEECLWRPGRVGLHVRQDAAGTWRADWPEREGYDIGPASIAWLTWHMCFWWSMVLDHSFGSAALTREAVVWPGSAEEVRTTLSALHARWKEAVASVDEAELASSARTRWPFTERPFVDIVAWANVELMKNAAELGYARFLYAVRDTTGA